MHSCTSEHMHSRCLARGRKPRTLRQAASRARHAPAARSARLSRATRRPAARRRRPAPGPARCAALSHMVQHIGHCNMCSLHIAHMHRGIFYEQYTLLTCMHNSYASRHASRTCTRHKECAVRQAIACLVASLPGENSLLAQLQAHVRARVVHNHVLSTTRYNIIRSRVMLNTCAQYHNNNIGRHPCPCALARTPCVLRTCAERPACAVRGEGAGVQGQARGVRGLQGAAHRLCSRGAI
jgi:hypothetical protein